MKDKIHPQYHSNLKITCACGNVILAGSTKKDVTTEICSGCHPFYTGQVKLVDTAGRVDKFLAKMKKAEEAKAKKTAKVDEGLDELTDSEGAKHDNAEKKTAKKAPAKKAKK